MTTSSAAPEVAEVAPPPPPCHGMVELAGGTFTMGWDPRRPLKLGPAPIEIPTRRATVAAFCLSRTEVTVDQYQACVRAGACTVADLRDERCNRPGAGRGDHPVNCVTWIQAHNYCAFRGARLPTEEEWEFAARGTAGRTYPWGEAPPFEPGSPFETLTEGTRPVGQRPAAATPEGIEDLAGNVWEWTSSPFCMHDNPGCVAEERMLKGSNNDSTHHRGSVRFNAPPTRRNPDTGFRCAGPGAAKPLTEAEGPASPVQKHWTEMPAVSQPTHRLLPGAPFPSTTRPKAGRVICHTAIRVAATGKPTQAKAAIKDDCTERFARIAEEEAMKAQWASRPHPVDTTVPVFIDHDAEQCRRCVVITVAPE